VRPEAYPALPVRRGLPDPKAHPDLKENPVQPVLLGHRATPDLKVKHQP